MQENQSEPQKQQPYYSAYTPYGTQPGQPAYTPQPGQPAQTLAAQPAQAAYTPQPGQPALTPTFHPGQSVQTPITPQPGQPMLMPAAPSEKVLPVTDKVPGVQAPLWVQHAALPQPGAPIALPVTQKPKRSGWRTVTIGALVCLFALIFGIGLFSGWTFARSQANTPSTKAPTTTASAPAVNDSADSLEAAQEAAIAKVEPAVVQIQGTLAQGESIGSGIIIDTQGDIVTNNHVVNGASSLTVVLNTGKQETAQLIGTDPANDLAVIRIQPFSSMAVAILGDSSQLTVGQEVIAIGNPLGFSGTATVGVVSALNRTESESNGVTLNGLIQTSAAINPGNSGGALINLQGQIVGIPTLSPINSETNTPAQGIGFAIPSNQVHSAITQILGH